MREDAAEPVASAERRGTGHRIGCLFSIGMAVLLAIGGIVVWLARERIADNVIAAQLDAYGIAATYEIESIGPAEQVLRNIVVGDPHAPDLTVERAIVHVVPRFGVPTLGRVTLVKPRLHATYIDGKLSFGALDPAVFGEGAGEGGLPDLDLELVDARALLEGDAGPVALKLAGSGNLASGFAGELAAIAPRLAAGGCAGQQVTLYGKVATKGGQPRFAGPARFTGLACGDLRLAAGAAQIDATADKALAAYDGKAVLALGRVDAAQGSVAGITGPLRLAWREGTLTAQYKLAASQFEAMGIGAGRVMIDGGGRARDTFATQDFEARLVAENVGTGGSLDRSLAGAQRGAAGTLLAPLLAQIRGTLARELPGSRFAADVTWRGTAERSTLVIPEARLAGASGATLLSASRLSYATRGPQRARLLGSFASGGDLPRITGHVEQAPGGTTRWRLAMAPYAAGSSRLAVPELALVQLASGALGFSGRIEASGALPGGYAERLVVPVAGTWASGELALGRGCTDVRFDRLAYANVTLDRRALTLCPPAGSAIVRYGKAGLRLAAGAPSLSLSGKLGETPLRVASGPVGFAYPGAVSARRLDVALGPADNAARFLVADLTARIGEDIAGNFAGADVTLAAVPLDLVGAGGTWRYAGSKLTLADGALTVRDREAVPRFEPLVTRGATLTLADNRIVAQMLLREPATDREVVQVAIGHDLETGRGHADLVVPGLVFDRRLQPAPRCSPTADGLALVRAQGGEAGLSCLVFGLVAVADGTVTGQGRIDWDEKGVTSRGRFSSDSLDFAAAFGPVKGASGTIEFTDLLGLTTAPGQQLRIASVNPGLEVNDGTLRFNLTGGQRLQVEDARWPFLGGTLTMRPVTLDFSVSEARRYVFEIEGMEAARFLERMEMSNLSASGIFDGTIPVAFDAQGNGRLDGGMLISRAPGGNVAYVGALTYEDMGAMANFAFQTLRSLDYRQMRIELDGPLAGEIVTRVGFDGVTQGEGARQNILTRQIARLPIRFNVNVRARFYDLISNLKSFYDPAAIKDPRSLEVGLLDAQGNRIPRTPTPPVRPATPDEAAIQRRESEDTP